MAGVLPTYLTTQTAAQMSVAVPFGLLTLINAAISAATAAGKFSATVDCSVFAAIDVTHVRTYLDSLGYKGTASKGDGDKSIDINWMIPPNIEAVVVQGSTPWVVGGTVSLSPGTVVTGSFTPATSSTATTIAETVTTASTVLLGTNANRKGFAIQNTNQIVFIKLDSTVALNLYSYELPKKGILEIENYSGPVSAITASGTVIVMVTEKV